MLLRVYLLDNAKVIVANNIGFYSWAFMKLLGVLLISLALIYMLLRDFIINIMKRHWIVSQLSRPIWKLYSFTTLGLAICYSFVSVVSLIDNDLIKTRVIHRNNIIYSQDCNIPSCSIFMRWLMLKKTSQLNRWFYAKST